MRNRVALFLIAALSLCFCNAYADDFISITPKISFPSQLILGQQALGEYQVTNNTGAPLNLTDQSTFSHAFSRITGTGYCSYNTYLDSGSSCLAAYTYTPKAGDADFQGQIKQHINGTSITVVVPAKISSQVIQQPVPGMPTLTFDKPELILDPGVREDLVVTNTSGTVTANNVKFTLPTDLATNIDSSTTCAAIAPHGNCTLYITAKSDAPTTTVPAYTPVQGSNTYPTLIPISVGTPTPNPFIKAYPVSFSSPSTQNLLLENTGAAIASVSSVTLPAGVHNVTLGAYDCSSIAAGGGTCNVPLTAATNAYGSGQISVQYNATPDATTTLSVANTSLQFLNGDETTLPDNELRVQKGTTVSFLVKNIGNFTWQGPTMSWTGSSDITFSPPTTYNTAPGATSEFSLEAASSAAPEYKGDLAASGTNASVIEASGVVTNGAGHALAIEPDVDANDLHLYYRAIRLDNIDPTSTATITALSTPIIIGKVVFCPDDSTTCAYKSGTDCKVGGTLSSGESCLLWYRAIPNPGAGLGPLATPAKITITVTADWTKNKHDLKEETQSRDFDIDYEQDLYAGGDFTAFGTSPGTTVNNIAKYDGSNWYAIGTGTVGTNGAVRALQAAIGDLFVGGSFTTAGGNSASKIAKWNGATWSAVGNGFSFSTSSIPYVYSLAGNEDFLFAAGTFDRSGSTTVYNIAKWSVGGTNWSEFGNPEVNPVNALNLTADGATLYAGGNGESVFETPTSSAGWLPRTAEHLFPTVFALTEADGYLYAGGELDSYQNIARTQLTGSDPWETLGTGLPSSPVFALTTGGNFVYIGGAFTNPLYVASVSRSDPTTINPVEGGPAPTAAVKSLTYFANTLYAGTQDNMVYMYDETAWTRLGNEFSGGAEGVLALTTAPSLVITASS